MYNNMIASVTNNIIIPESIHFIRYFLSIKASKSSKTAIAYERDIKDFFQRGIEDITINDIRKVTIFDSQKFILDLNDSGASSATISRKISALSSLYKWLLKYQDNTTGYRAILYNPFGNLREEKPVINNKLTEFLTLEESKALIESISTRSVIGLRNKAIVALAITTALRKSEIINIKLSDITTFDGYDVIKVIRKGNKHDMVKLQAPVRNLIEEYIRRTGRSKDGDSDKYLFTGHAHNGLNGLKLNESTLNYIIDSVIKMSGIKKKLKVHGTRHTAITLAIIAGATVEKVRDFAGHKTLSSTNRYIHSIDNMRNYAGDLISVI